MTMVSAQFPVSLRDEIARNAQAYDRSLSQPCARRRGSTWRRLFNEGPPPPRKPRTCHDGSRRRPRERCGRPCGRPPGERRMTYLIATSTFLDPTDNQPVIAGATVVAPEAAVVRLHPERFRPIERGNLGMPGGGLERVGGVTGFHRAGIRQRAPSRKRPVKPSVELREHYVDYRVSLGTSAREAILTEIEPTGTPARKSRPRVGCSASTGPEPTATGQRWLSPPARSNDPAPAARSI